MRRFVVLIVVALLGISSVGLVSESASAQGIPADQIEECKPGSESHDPWEGVCEPFTFEVPVPALPDGQQVMQPYLAVFKQQDAATWPISQGEEGYPAEFMVIYVREGAFAIDLDAENSGAVLVSTWTESIATLAYNQNADPKSEHPEFTDDGEPFYTPNGTLIDGSGMDCTIACPLSPGQAVQLGPGDMAVAEAGTVCLFCLLNTGDISVDDERGILEVFVLRDSNDPIENFSWIRNWMTYQSRTESLDPTSTFAWRLFNPGTRCKSH